MSSLGGNREEFNKDYTEVKDSGARRTFDSGAVRDVAGGKGRYDLLPPYAVRVVLKYIGERTASRDIPVLREAIAYALRYTQTRNEDDLIYATVVALRHLGGPDLVWCTEGFRRVAVHFENGAAKYEERNWEKGIPTHCFIDSGVRHCFKVLAGLQDEDHEAAIVWNFLCAIETVHRIRKGRLPQELDDLPPAIDCGKVETSDHSYRPSCTCLYCNTVRRFLLEGELNAKGEKT